MGSYGQLIDGLEVIKKVYPVNSPWRNVKPDYLIDCPRCGAKQEDHLVACSYFGFKVGVDGWSAYCRSCFASTGFCHTHEEAIDKWNRRDLL